MPPLVHVEHGRGGAFAVVARDDDEEQEVREVGRDTPTSNGDGDPDAKTVEYSNNIDRSCVGGCGSTGRWRFPTRNYVCADCGQKAPHKLITRGKAKSMYNLTFDELHRAMLGKQIQMFSIRNYHDANAPMIRLYYVHEIESLARRLRKIR